MARISRLLRVLLSDAEAKLFGVGDERNACCFRVMTHSPSWAPKVKGQSLAAAVLLTSLQTTPERGGLYRAARKVERSV